MLHGVNGHSRFDQSLYTPVHMLEVDIEDNGDKSEDPILSHEGVGDVPFRWAIERCKEYNKSLKVDLKRPNGTEPMPEFYEEIFGILATYWNPDIPLWINADVSMGPNWEKSRYGYVEPERFIHVYNDYWAGTNTMLSLGYLTGYEANTPQPYTLNMLEEMREIVGEVDGIVTISLRYINLMANLGILEEFLNLGPVTIWNREDTISEAEFAKLEEDVGRLNVFKDLTGNDGRPIWGLNNLLPYRIKSVKRTKQQTLRLP